MRWRPNVYKTSLGRLCRPSPSQIESTRMIRLMASKRRTRNTDLSVFVCECLVLVPFHCCGSNMPAAESRLPRHETAYNQEFPNYGNEGCAVGQWWYVRWPQFSPARYRPAWLGFSRRTGGGGGVTWNEQKSCASRDSGFNCRWKKKKKKKISYVCIDANFSFSPSTAVTVWSNESSFPVYLWGSSDQ